MEVVVPLNRLFIEWTASDSDSSDANLGLNLFGLQESLSWQDLLTKHRVVILAEAGSGKTTELVQQALSCETNGFFSFYATLQKIGQGGLARALGKGRQRKFDQWKHSDQPGWFFFDSVDEAKESSFRLEDILIEIADEIDGCESRTHIVLSGRYSDWEFIRDLEHIETYIGMPPADIERPEIDPNELLISLIRRDNPPEPPPPAEAPLVVVMAELDQAQVKLFAKGKGVQDAEAFLSSLEKSNAWDFARRPLDLDWLVEAWRAQGKFGPLVEMMDLSIRERLIESDPHRNRNDPVTMESAIKALDRIGAGLTFQGLRDIAVPDSGMGLGEKRQALELSEILPDWSGEHRTKLLSRSIFDPASAGLARIHNDNSGAVRSFLAARWLKNQLDANCSKSIIWDLLFATTYGMPLVIPSMRQTVAWMSLLCPDTASKVVGCDPRLLMDAGDPASLQLSVREKALEAFVQQLIDDDGLDIPDRDSLKRFALQDIAPSVRKLWEMHGRSQAVRELLLLMIWLGELTACADIATSASFGTYTDRYTTIFSGRALMAVGTASDKRCYVQYIKDHAESILSVLAWDAVDTLFLTELSIDDLLVIINAVDTSDRSGGINLDYLSPVLAERLESADLAEQLLQGLLRTPEALGDDEGEPEELDEKPVLILIEATGRRLLELSELPLVPPLAIDAAIRLSRSRHRINQWRPSSRNKETIFTLLNITPERRRESLWQSFGRLSGDHSNRRDPINNIWQIEHEAGCPDISPEDFDWLLQDADSRPLERERLIAVNACLALWNQAGKPQDRLNRIQSIGSAHPEVLMAIEDWMHRSTLPDDEERLGERRIREEQYRAKLERRDQSWLNFADQLRADPNQLRQIAPPTEISVDARLYHLWMLLRDAGANRSTYAINDLSPLEPLLGLDVVNALKDAFINYWRHWSPTRLSERQEAGLNSIKSLDIIGIVGVTLEASESEAWAYELSYQDAELATRYALHELNGYPDWLINLAQDQPDATREVLLRAIAPEFTSRNDAGYCRELEKVANSDKEISVLVSSQVFEHLSQNDEIPLRVLWPMLRILDKGEAEGQKLEQLLSDRFSNAADIAYGANYFASFFKLAPDKAIDLLDIKLNALSQSNQTLLVQAILPMLYGRRWVGFSVNLPEMPFSSLLRLTEIAYRTIRIEEDNFRANGKAYTPDARDDAESARGAMFKALIDTPGISTFNAVNYLMEQPDFPISRDRMMKIARERAGKDSEHQAWAASDVYAFESDYQVVPANPLDLQRLALRVLKDLQHDLLHSDYAQGKTVARLPKEVDVQNWMADRLKMSQVRSYSIEREPHVVDEKEPDIRFCSIATPDASVPMEIKVVESWSLSELEVALETQLVGQYLRDRNNRYGILLLVYQKKRVKGWKGSEGFLQFEQVVDHLRKLALSIAAKTPESQQAEIAIIDVSSAISSQ